MSDDYPSLLSDTRSSLGRWHVLDNNMGSRHDCCDKDIDTAKRAHSSGKDILCVSE